MSETSYKKARPVIASGFSSKNLTQGIADYMNCQRIDVRDKEHADNEIEPALLGNVRGRDFIAVASAAGNPTKQMFELQLLEASSRGSGARSITALIPYMWYGRSDSSFSERKTSALRSVIKNVSDCDQVIVADPHNAVLTSGIFESLGVNTIVVQFAYPFAVQLTEMFNRSAISKDRLMFVHPDAGSTKRIDTPFREALYTTLGLDTTKPQWKPSSDSWEQIPKNRDKQSNESNVKDLHFSVEGKDIVLFEDMIASGGTACDLAAALKAAGARNVTLFATNGLFTPKSYEIETGYKTASVDRINNSALDYVFITNTYDHSLVDPEIHAAIESSKKIHVVDVAPYLGAILNAIHMEVFEDTPDDANSVSAIKGGKHPDQAKMAKATPLKYLPAYAVPMPEVA